MIYGNQISIMIRHGYKSEIIRIFTPSFAAEEKNREAAKLLKAIQGHIRSAAATSGDIRLKARLHELKQRLIKS